VQSILSLLAAEVPVVRKNREQIRQEKAMALAMEVE